MLHFPCSHFLLGSLWRVRLRGRDDAKSNSSLFFFFCPSIQRTEDWGQKGNVTINNKNTRDLYNSVIQPLWHTAIVNICLSRRTRSLKEILLWCKIPKHIKQSKMLLDVCVGVCVEYVHVYVCAHPGVLVYSPNQHIFSSSQSDYHDLNSRLIIDCACRTQCIRWAWKERINGSHVRQITRQGTDVLRKWKWR